MLSCRDVIVLKLLVVGGSARGLGAIARGMFTACFGELPEHSVDEIALVPIEDR